MSGSFLEKDLTMCCPAASVYILCIFLLTACKTIHFTNGCCVRFHTDFCHYLNSFPRKIQRLCCENHGLGRTACGFGKPVTEFFEFRKSATVWKICQAFMGKSASFFWEVCHQSRKSPAYFGKMSPRLWENQPLTLGK